MRKHCPENERIKRRYFRYLKEAKRQSEGSIDAVAKALDRFETYTRHKEFKAFHIEQAAAFKRHLSEQRSQRTNEGLSKATLYSTLGALKAFFRWLADQPGYRKRVSYSDAEYFNLSDKETRIAKAVRPQPTPSLEQVLHVIRVMPSVSEIQLRDQALIAFALATGARDGALVSLRFKHVDLRLGCVIQDAREVRTKFSKSFPTYFFPVGGEVIAVIENWIEFLRHQKLWGPDDPLFPATLVRPGAGERYQVVGLGRRPWKTAAPVRKIFRAAFEAQGLPYYHPHSLRRTLVRLGEQRCRTPEEFKAWSQNLGHEQVMTTFTSYGQVPYERQGELILGVGKRLEGSGSA
jgi:integrase